MTLFFFFNDTATTEIYTLSLHDALPILSGAAARGGPDLHAAVRAQSRSPLQGHAGGAARAIHLPEATARHGQRRDQRGDHDPQRAGPARRPAAGGVRHHAPGAGRPGPGRAAGRDRGRAVSGAQPVVPGPAELSPDAGGTDQRAERDGGGRAWPTARASLRRVPHVRRRAATPVAGVARGPGWRPAGGERGAARGQAVADPAQGGRAAPARAGDGAVGAQTDPSLRARTARSLRMTTRGAP